MNVLYISHCNGLEGGASFSLLYLMKEMKKKGVNVYLLVPEKKRHLTYIYRLNGIKVIGFHYDRWIKENRKQLIGKKYIDLVKSHWRAKKISDKIKKLNIDIIHTNSSVVNIGGLINKYTSIPHVWHIREFGEEDYNLYYYYGKKYSINFMNKNSSKIITVSKALYKKYESSLREKMTVIYNGISNEYINPKKNFLSDLRSSKKINISISGTIHPGKGQEEAILAVNELIKQGYINLHLYIAAQSSDKDYEEKLKGIVKKCKIESNIHFVGYKSDLKELRQMSCLELVCSRKEAFGRVTIEAMLSMNPVIGANAGGTKELIINGFNGILYKSGDYKDLANKIVYFLKKPEKIEYMGKNGFEYALKNFTSEKNADQIYRIYSEILEE